MSWDEIWAVLSSARIGSTVLVVLSAVALVGMVRAVARRVAEPTSRRFVIKTADYVTALVSIGVITKVWVQTFNLGTLFGLTAAGLALALKDPVASFAGWFFILIRHPFRVKDRIQIGSGLAGDVVDIRLFMFSVLEIGNWVQGDQHTGRVVHIPNSVVFTTPIANYTAPLPWVWHEHSFHITYDSDWETARAVLLSILTRHAESVSGRTVVRPNAASGQFGNFTAEVEPNVWLSVTPYCVRLSLRYLCDPRRRRLVESEISSEALTALRGTLGVRLAYPTQQVVVDAARDEADGSPPTGSPPGPGVLPRSRAARR